ncbi:MAG: glycosyltransferase family 9 protein [Lentisphaerae bacterium]|nr:glycosyltransferase family 9 protein [Lentisphaerota bacterium]
MTTSALKKLKMEGHGCRITLITLKENSELAELIPAVNTIYYISHSTFKLKNLLLLAYHILKLKVCNFDLVLLFHVGFFPRLMAYAIGGRKVVMPGKGSLNKLVSKDGRTFSKKLNHYCDAYPQVSIEAIKKLGYRPSKRLPIPELSLPKNVAHICRKYHNIVSRKYIAVFPGGGVNLMADTKAKRYPQIQEALELVGQKYKGQTLVLLGAATDKSDCEKLESYLSPWFKCINTSGYTSFQEFAILIKKAKVLVTMDSSAMHVGIAYRTPLIALFGPTDPDELFFPSDHSFVFRPKAKPLYSGKFKGDEGKAIKIFESIAPERVAEKIIEYIKQYIVEDHTP